MSYNRNGNGNAGHDPNAARARAELRSPLRARNAVPAPAPHRAAGEATTAPLAVSRPSRSRATVAVVASLGLVGAGLVGIAQASSTPQPVSFFSASDVPSVKSDPDPNSVELGMRFTSSVAGSVTAVRFWKGTQDTGTHVGNLWTSSGIKLASATFSNETASGWQQASFGAPVKLSAGSVYTVSYFAPKGGYGVTEGYFSSAHTSGPLTAPSRRNGVYKYGSASAFPTSTYNASNYFVDVVFRPNALITGATPATSSAAPTVAAAPQTTAAPAPGGTQTTAPPVSSGTQAGFPTAATTGVPSGTVLTRSGSLTLSTPGQVVSGLDISGTVSITASNVTIKNCRITGSSFAIVNIADSAKGTVVSDTEINGLGTSEGANGINGTGTFTRLNIHGVENSINATGPLTLRDSYLWGLQAPGSPHYDDVQIDGGVSNVLIDHNTIINTFDQTSAVMIDNYFGPISNITVSNNRLVGGGYTVYSDAGFTGGSITGVAFTGNRLVQGYWGYHDLNKNSPTWSGNVDDVTGAPIS